MGLFYRIAKTLGIQTKYDLRQEVKQLEEELKKKDETYSQELGQRQQRLELLQKELEVQKSLNQDLERRLKEDDKLSEIILKDKESAEAEIKRLLYAIRSKEGSLGILSSLTEFERGVLCKYIPKKTSTIPPEKKIHYRRVHTDPDSFEKFLSELARCEYIQDIYGGGQTHRNAKGIIFDRDRREHSIFIIEGLYSRNNLGKRFYVHTTAGNKQEMEYIKHLLNSQFSK